MGILEGRKCVVCERRSPGREAILGEILPHRSAQPTRPKTAFRWKTTNEVHSRIHKNYGTMEKRHPNAADPTKRPAGKTGRKRRNLPLPAQQRKALRRAIRRLKMHIYQCWEHNSEGTAAGGPTREENRGEGTGPVRGRGEGEFHDFKKQSNSR